MEFNLFGKKLRFTLSSASDNSFIRELLGAYPTSTGITVTPENSLQFSAVYACVRVISDQISSFPKGVYKRLNERERTKDYLHPVYRLIDSEPNEFYSAFDFWDVITTSVLLWGNGFAKILRDPDTYYPVSFELMLPGKTKIYYERVDGEMVLLYENVDTHELIPARDMLHFKGLSFDGVKGKSVIEAFAKESVGLSVAAEKFGAKFFGNDTMMTKYLSHPGRLGQEALKNLQDSWQKSYGGLDEAFKMKVLEEGMKLENVGIPPEQAQFLGTRQHQVEEICRWFKVQPHLIQHLLRSTNNNIEHQGIEFVTHTLTPWVVRFEHELNRKLFTEKEKRKTYIKFNMASLLRGDIAARTAHYTQMINWGVYSPNEVREMEDRNPREGGDKYLTPLNMTNGTQPEPMKEPAKNKINGQN